MSFLPTNNQDVDEKKFKNILKIAKQTRALEMTAPRSFDGFEKDRKPT